MIIMFPQGRLGNQIFQYQFVRYQMIDKHERIITSWKSEYHKIFDDELRYWHLPNRNNISYSFFKFLASIGLISSIAAEHIDGGDHPIETGSFVKKKGLISRLRFIDGFFQTDRYISRESLKIKAPFLNAAKAVLKDLFGARKVFVHVRQGDYSNVVVFGKKDCTLPAEYYRKAMLRFAGDENVVFVVMSDDRNYAESLFPRTGTRVLMHAGSLELDFALMSLCDGAIISASSFSWWGAYLMKDSALKVAPKYWMGFKSGRWFPHGIDTERFEFLEVRNDLNT